MPFDERVITLEEYGYEKFRNELKRIGKENKTYDKRNIDWFDTLPDTFLDYDEWFFLFDGNKPAAFSTIQKYYNGCYRLLTRTYIYRDYRIFMNPRKADLDNPTMTMRLLPHQLNHIDCYTSAFVSMQSISRRPAISRYSSRMQAHTKLDWNLAPNMMLTCDKDYGKDCWQNIIYNGKKPDLQEMTIEEWKDKWQKSV